MILLLYDRKQRHTYWSRLITLSASSSTSVLVTVGYDDVDGDCGGQVLRLNCPDLSKASAITALLCSSLQFSPSYTTREIKPTFRASESTRKCLKEKTLESLPISDRNRDTPIKTKEENRVLMPSKASETKCNVQTLKSWMKLGRWRCGWSDEWEE